MKEHSEVEWEALEQLGAAVQYFVQRCVYLFQVPGAEPGRPMKWRDVDAALASRITGAVLDLCNTVGGAAQRLKGLQASETVAGVEFRVLLGPEHKEVTGAGLDALKLASDRFERRASSSGDELIFEVTGRSIQAAAKPTSSECGFAVAGKPDIDE